MARIDLEPLFTNFPINKTIKNTVDDLLSNNMYLGKLSKSELHYLLKLATSGQSLFLAIFRINKLMESLWLRL